VQEKKRSRGRREEGKWLFVRGQGKKKTPIPSRVDLEKSYEVKG